METIPLVEDTDNATTDAAPTIAEANRPAPLAVEPLEDRVLLASDAVPAAPVADTPATEPAPYVARQQTGSLAIDLGDAVETGGAEHNASDMPASLAGGQQPARPPSHGEAEPVENKSDTIETPVPERNDSGEQEPERNKFGLATIEPETESPEALSSPGGQGSLRKLVALGSPREGESEPASRDGGAVAGPDPAAVEIAVPEMANELGSSLPNTVQLEPRLHPSAEKSNRPAAAEALPVNEQLDALVQPVLKSELEVQPSSDVELPDDSAFSRINADINAVERTVGTALHTRPASLNAPSERQDQDQHAAHNRMPETPPAAHDALFAAGDGVEAVLAPARDA